MCFRFAPRRPDVLLFTSAPFEEATPIVGAMSIDLWVFSDRNDTDFTVKVRLLAAAAISIARRRVLPPDWVVSSCWITRGVASKGMLSRYQFQTPLPTWRVWLPTSHCGSDNRRLPGGRGRRLAPAHRLDPAHAVARQQHHAGADGAGRGPPSAFDACL